MSGFTLPSKPVDSVRILLQVGDEIRRVVGIQWGKSDASLYLFPSVPSGGFSYAGTTKFPGPRDAPSTFDYSRQLVGVDTPKLSIHESGRCHATIGDESTAALFGPDLFEPTGGHIATVSCFSPEGLPTIKTPRGPTGKRPDFVLQSSRPETWTSSHISIHVSAKPHLDGMNIGVVTLRRPGRPGPLYVGIHGRVGDSEDEERRGRGVLALAGWGPGPQTRTSTAVYAVTSVSPPSGGPAGTPRRNPTFHSTR